MSDNPGYNELQASREHIEAVYEARQVCAARYIRLRESGRWLQASALAKHIAGRSPLANDAKSRSRYGAACRWIFDGLKAGNFITRNLRPHLVDGYGLSRLEPEFATERERVFWHGRTLDYANRPALTVDFLQPYLEMVWLPAGPTRQCLDAHGLPIPRLLADQVGPAAAVGADKQTGTADAGAPQPDPTPTPRKIGRPSSKDEIHRALDALVAAKDQRVHVPNLAAVARLVAQHCKEEIGQSPGWSLRTVTDHISAWRRGHGSAA
jgi:hypothetical protein